jgi:NAD(P)-dependent dehydrogenase (short-subunit alcohol dehydrogenase family)
MSTTLALVTFVPVLAVTLALVIFCTIQKHRKPYDWPTEADVRAVSTGYAIVTGANRPSIGFRVAQKLAASPHRYTVVLACRDPEKGRETAAEILADNFMAKVLVLPLDLSSFKSVREFVKLFEKLPHLQRPAGLGPTETLSQPPSLHLLVLNAGVSGGLSTARTETPEGHETHLGVNHLGHFLLANLLTPRLKEATAQAPRLQGKAVNGGLTTEGGARVVIVSSSLHDPAASGGCPVSPANIVASSLGSLSTGSNMVDLDNLQLERPGSYGAGMAYCRSKACNMLMAYEMQRRLHGTGVAVNAVNPGLPTLQPSRLRVGVHAV